MHSLPYKTESSLFVICKPSIGKCMEVGKDPVEADKQLRINDVPGFGAHTDPRQVAGFILRVYRTRNSACAQPGLNHSFPAASHLLYPTYHSVWETWAHEVTLATC